MRFLSRHTLALVLLATPLAAQGSTLVAGPHVVNVSCCAFADPANNNSNETIIAWGTTVKWVKTDAFDYTVTSGTGPSDPNAGVLFNGSLIGANTIYTRTFNTFGTFPYFCTLHTNVNMSGILHVINQAVVFSLDGGCLASNGAQLTLGNNGPPRVGNAAFGLIFNGGVSGSPAYVFLASGLAASPLVLVTGCVATLDLVSVAALIQAGITPTGPQALNAFGSTTFAFPVPNDPSLAGFTAHVQGLVLDAGVPGGVVLSDTLIIIVGA